ncbi:MAG TPA: hypothetical protein DCZ91_20805 [Lachnospiraceae bacterium]|nr:hypothetical protein [Lachnospiraceae bacterium]
MEDGLSDNSYYFELNLYQHIRNGNIKTLNDFFTSSALRFREGKKAQTPLRHAKNVFIMTAAKIEMIGAIHHTNEPLCADDVARQIHRSSSYIMKKFKNELGFTIADFIMRCRLEEAKSLLTFSDKTWQISAAIYASPVSRIFRICSKRNFI